jgi:hypothetical protein
MEILFTFYCFLFDYYLFLFNIIECTDAGNQVNSGLIKLTPQDHISNAIKTGASVGAT